MTYLQPMNRFIDEFDIAVEPDGKTYTVSIKTSEKAVVRAVEVLHFVLGCSTRIMKAMGNASSQVRASAVTALRQAQHKALSQAYFQFRAQGHKHRAAIACVLDTDLAKTMHYTKTEIYQCVRAYPEMANILTTTKKEDDYASQREIQPTAPGTPAAPACVLAQD